MAFFAADAFCFNGVSSVLGGLRQQANERSYPLSPPCADDEHSASISTQTLFEQTSAFGVGACPTFTGAAAASRLLFVDVCVVAAAADVDDYG